MLDAKELAVIGHGRWVQGVPTQGLSRFTLDSRILEPGEVFIALKTDRRDGHSYLDDAHRKGAVAAFVEQPDRSLDLPQLVVPDTYAFLRSIARIWRQRFSRPVVGITGSFGKTTVKELLGTVMGNQWYRTRGNLNNTLGVPLSLLELDDHQHAGAILEAGINQPGEMAILADLIDPDLALFTGVGAAHLEGLGDLDGVAREKALLGSGVRPGGLVVLPVGLLRYAAFQQIPASIRLQAVSLDKGGAFDPVMRENVALFYYKWTDLPDRPGHGLLETVPPLPPLQVLFPAGSPGMVSNLALVVHTALQLGVPRHTLEACLESWRPFRHRGECYRHGERIFYVDCYNANPASLLDSVQRFKNLFAGQRQLYVLGSMDELGPESERWHRETASRLDLPEGARVFVVGHGAAALASGLESAGFSAESFQSVEDLEAIRGHLTGFAGAVFLKGSRSQALETLLPAGARKC